MKFIIVIFAIFLTIAADEFVDQPPAETRYRGWPRFQFRRPTTESPIVPGDPPNPRDPPNSGDLPKPIGPPEVNRPLNPVGSPKGGDLPKPIGRLNPVVPPNDGELPKPDGSPEVNGPPDSGQPRDGDHPIDDNPFNREIPKISGDSTDQKVPVNPEVPKLPYSPPTEGSPVNPGQLMPAPPLMLAPTTSAPVILADPSPECVKLVKDFVEREYYRSFSGMVS